MIRVVVAIALLIAAAAPVHAKPKLVLAWTGSSTVRSATGVTVVSPSWWFLNKDGTLDDRAKPTPGHTLWPLFGNRIDPDASHAVMSDPARRAALIQAVRDSARRVGAHGINIDWENLHEADRDLFSAFVREAAADWHQFNLTVSVDVTPMTDTWALGNWSTSFDRKALGQATDFVVLMAYDEHNRLRRNGPTASLPWVRSSIESLLRDVPANKVILGMPFYMRDWSEDPARQMETVTIEQAPARLKTYNAQTRWDEATGTTYATYVRDGYEHRIWVEDERSLALKAAFVDTYQLAGAAVWRLGFGTDAAWRVVAGTSGPVALTTPVPATVAPTPTSVPVVTPTLAPAVQPSAPPAVRRLPGREGPSVGLLGIAASVLVAAGALSLVLARRRRRPPI
jgi:hypothetical protein